MSNSKKSFDLSIQEAESILGFYDRLNEENSRSNDLEVLKRSGLIIALTAWETYVEDRIEESVAELLAKISESAVNKFILTKLKDELKRFHTPNSDKTRKLFLDYLDIDIHKSWSWNPLSPKDVKNKLDDLVSKRGEAAHRAKSESSGPKKPDLIKIDELRKSIGFLKNLVEVTDKALEANTDE
ncbi:MAG TPA: HEPN domain-containing protein [Methylophilaceae bacterium]|nr:HEPN domain-containing protein [Methylophilaceae bacterium]